VNVDGVVAAPVPKQNGGAEGDGVVPLSEGAGVGLPVILLESSVRTRVQSCACFAGSPDPKVNVDGVVAAPVPKQNAGAEGDGVFHLSEGTGVGLPETLLESSVRARVQSCACFAGSPDPKVNVDGAAPVPKHVQNAGAEGDGDFRPSEGAGGTSGGS